MTLSDLFSSLRSLVGAAKPTFAPGESIVYQKGSSPKIVPPFEDFCVRSITGEEVVLSRYKGKKVLVVNVASRCGFTKQYQELQKLYEMHGDKVTVLGFPANNFLWQEPGTNEEIASFCRDTYGVTFPMFEKISVRGEDQHPLYRWLSDKSLNGVLDIAPGWNFCKYLLDEEGRLLAYFPPKISPLDKAIVEAVAGNAPAAGLSKSA
jgi:glutathione peroxidase